jgi:hypothetical protein
LAKELGDALMAHNFGKWADIGAPDNRLTAQESMTMIDKERMSLILTEVAQRLDVDGLLAMDDRDAWFIGFNENTEIDVELDPSGHRVTFQCSLGRPDDARRDHLCRTLLQYNYLWRETGGMRMALDGADGEVVQIFDMPSESVDAESVQNVLGNFAQAASAWREMLSRGGDTPNPAAFGMYGMPPGAIMG